MVAVKFLNFIPDQAAPTPRPCLVDTEPRRLCRMCKRGRRARERRLPSVSVESKCFIFLSFFSFCLAKTSLNIPFLFGIMTLMVKSTFSMFFSVFVYQRFHFQENHQTISIAGTSKSKFTGSFTLFTYFTIENLFFTAHN